MVLCSGAQLPTELQQVNLSGVDLSKRDLSRHNLTGANLTNANVSGSLFVVCWCRVALVRCVDCGMLGMKLMLMLVLL